MFDWSEWLPYILGALVIGAFVFALIGAFNSPRKPKDDVPPPEDDHSDDSSDHLVLGDLTGAMAGQLPGKARDQAQVLPQLQAAGYYRPTALVEYQAVRTMLVLVPLVAAAAIALFVPNYLIPRVLLGGLIFAILGFSLPRIYVAVRARRRAREIERGLPIFADLLSLALVSGQSLLNGMRRVTDQIRLAYPGLAQELEIVLRQAELYNLTTAFEQWAQRSGVADVRNLSTILTQSQKLGNDPSTVLLEYATNIRITLRQRADGHAQRTGLWMLFPSILCMWLPALVLLTAPVFFEINKQRTVTRDILNEAKGAMNPDAPVTPVVTEPELPFNPFN